MLEKLQELAAQYNNYVHEWEINDRVTKGNNGERPYTFTEWLVYYPNV